MTGKRNNGRVWTGLLLAGALAAAGCGGDDGAGTAAPTTTAAGSDQSAAPPVTDVITTDVPATAAPSTVAPTTTEAAPAELWSATAADELVALQAAQSGSGDVADTLTRLFAQPGAVPWPTDAVLTEVWVTSNPLDDGSWVTDYRYTVASAMTPVDLETLAVEAFADGRWEPGLRVESTLESGVFVTLNHPATADAAAEGWGSMAITVGPETDFGTATGRNEMEFSVERTVASADALELTWFMEGWVAEMPVAEGLELVYLDATDADTGVWMAAEFTAPADQFEALVQFYAQDHTGGALVLDSSSPPEDLSALDYFTAGFFPTLAGYDIFVTVERDLADPAAPVRVGLSVRVES